MRRTQYEAMIRIPYYVRTSVNEAGNRHSNTPDSGAEELEFVQKTLVWYLRANAINLNVFN